MGHEAHSMTYAVTFRLTSPVSALHILRNLEFSASFVAPLIAKAERRERIRASYPTCLYLTSLSLMWLTKATSRTLTLIAATLDCHQAPYHLILGSSKWNQL